MLKKEGSIFEKISFALMTSKLKQTIWLSLLVIPLLVSGSSPLRYFARPNGLTLFFLTTDKPARLSFSFQAGTQHEMDSFPGIARLTHEIIALKCQENPLLSAAGFETSFSKDLSTFHFNQLNPNQIEGIAEAFRGTLSDALISEEMIRRACNNILLEEKNMLEDKKNILPLYYLKKLYGSQYTSVYPYGAYLVSPEINPAIVRNFLNNFYTPVHCAILFQSNQESDFSLLKNVEAWDNWEKLLYNFQSINRFIDFKQIIKSSQKVFFGADSTRLEYVFLLPGIAGVDQKGLEMVALNHLVKNYFQQFAPIASALELRAHDSRLTISLTCSPEHVDSFHPLMVNTLRHFFKRIPESGYKQAIQDAVKERDSLRQVQPEHYLKLAAQTTHMSNVDFIRYLEDSLAYVNTKKLYLVAAEYISQGDFIATLQTDSATYMQHRMDSVFSDADESIIQLSIPFPKNGYELIDTLHLPYLYKLEQWVKLNPDVLIQINGLSDSREFNKAYDDSMLLFMDTLPEFKRIMPEIIKKRYLTMEMMRSMQILRWLYWKGIAADRLSGTCQRIKNKQQPEEDNMRCTATFPAVRNAIVSYQQVQFAKP